MRLSFLLRSFVIASCAFVASVRAQVHFHFDWTGSPYFTDPSTIDPTTLKSSYGVMIDVFDNQPNDTYFSVNLIGPGGRWMAQRSVTKQPGVPIGDVQLNGNDSQPKGIATYLAHTDAYDGTYEENTWVVWVGDSPPTVDTFSLSTTGAILPNDWITFHLKASDIDGNLFSVAIYYDSEFPQSKAWLSFDPLVGSTTQDFTIRAPATPGTHTAFVDAQDQAVRVTASSVITFQVASSETYAWRSGFNGFFTYAPNQAPDILGNIVPNVQPTVSLNPSVQYYQNGTLLSAAPTHVGTYQAVITVNDPTYTYAGATTLTYSIVPVTVSFQFSQSTDATNIITVSSTTPPINLGWVVVNGQKQESAPAPAGTRYHATAAIDGGATTDYVGSGSLDWDYIPPATGTPPTVTINPSSSSIAAGQSVTITWSATNDPNHRTTQVTITGDGIPSGDGTVVNGSVTNSYNSSSPSALSGSFTIGGLTTGSHTYGISATNDGGAHSQSTVVQVAPGSVTAWITASPTSVASGPATTTIAWGSTNASTVTVKGAGAAPTGINSPSPSGNQPTLSLPASPYPYVFTISASGATGSATQTASFQVGPAAQEAPTITWVGLLPDAVAVNGNITIAAAGHDRNGDVTSVKIQKDGSDFQVASDSVGKFDLTASGTLQPATTGTITFTAQAFDAAGHSSNILTHSVYVGTVAGAGLGEGTLPAATPVVATLDGQVSVDNHGTADYSIPLKIPPARLGMEPKVSLSYNSASGNGPLGIGWSLSTGFPHSITRGRTIYARDGIVRGVHFDGNDKYYLDGKRLLCTSGSEGQPNSQYRTEVESFINVAASGTGSNIDTFTVLTKDGLKMIFGKYSSATDGYQVGAYDSDGNGIVASGELDSLAYAYALKHVEDTLGNSIDFAYATDNDGEYELSDITYTGNQGLSIAAQAKVHCVYNLNKVGSDTTVFRADMPSRYMAERVFPLHKRLDRIVISNAGGATLTGLYDLKYEYSPDNGPTRLIKVQGYLKDPVTQTMSVVNPTTFDWSAGSSSAHRAMNYTPISNDGSWAAPSRQGGGSNDRFAFADVNGDGKDDLIDFTDGTGVWVSLSNGSGLEPRVQWLTGAPWSRTVNNASVPPGIVKVCDVNGDGKKDLVFWQDATGSDQQLYVAISDGSKFTATASGITFGTAFKDPGTTSGTQIVSQEGSSVTSRIAIGDFNGDGRDDILIHGYDGKLTVLKSTGTGFTAQAPCPVGANAIQIQEMWAIFGIHFLGFNYTQNFSVQMIPCDLNGDGLTDYAWVETTARWGDYSSQLLSSGESVHGTKLLFAVTTQVDQSGNVTFSPMTQVVGNGWGAGTANVDIPYRYTSFLIETADVNGDGLTDFIFTRPSLEVTDPNTHQPQLVLAHEIYLSQGSAGTPKFKNIGTVIPSTVQVGGTTINTWFDKVTAGLWRADAYEYMGWAAPVWQPGDPRRETFMVLGLSSPADNIVMTDVNGDGLADYVWFDSGSQQWMVLYSRGESFAQTPVAMPLGWTPSQQVQEGTGTMYQSFRSQLDLNGDGVPDFACDDNVSYADSPGVSKILVSSTDASTARPGDRLVAVTNGFGSKTTINYTPVTDDTIYTPGASAISYPIRELRNSSYVVSDVEKDTGGAQTAQFQYQYSGNELDLSGRGSLGFHSFVTVDTATRVFKYQFLAQSFPMTGLTQREQTYRSWNDLPNVDFRVLSSHDNTVVYDSVVNGGGSVFPFISQAVESRWEDSNSAYTFQVSATARPTSQPETAFSTSSTETPYVKITASSKFDSQGAVQTSLVGNGAITNGNLMNLSTDYGDGTTESVSNTYFDAPASTVMSGRLQDTTTTVTSSSGSQTGPKKSYTYYNATPLVETEKVDGSAATNGDSSGKQTITTTYGHDSRGRVTATSISGTDLQFVGQNGTSYTVSSNTTFDNTFDLPTTTLDAYLHPTTTVYDPIVGQPLSITGPNASNDTTTFAYDALGRTVSVTDRFGLTTTTNYSSTSAVSVAASTVTQPSTLPSQDGGSPVDGISAYAVQVSPANKPPVTTYYDRLSRPIKVVKQGFTMANSDTVYNTLGQTVATSVPYASGNTSFWTISHFDPLGRPDSVTAPNGTVTTTKYNGLGTQTTVSSGSLDGGAQKNTTLVDAHGRTVSVWNADNVPDITMTNWQTGTPASIVFQLDGFGRMRETDLKGQTQPVTATYDALGRQTSLVDPDKGTWNYINSALGQVLQQTDAHGTVTATTYDIYNRPLTRTTQEPSSGPLETANWNYYDSTIDANATARHLVPLGSTGWIGALQQESTSTVGTGIGYATANSANSTTHYYDTFGRPQIDLNAIDGTWFYSYTTYDPQNRVKTVQDFWRPAAGTNSTTKVAILAGTIAPYTWRSFGYTYNYDGNSYVLSVADTNTPSRTWWSAGNYDELDRPVVATRGTYTTTRTYQKSDGTLTGISTVGGLATLQNFAYTYDGVGNLKSRTDNSRTPAPSETLTYDWLNRLTNSAQGAVSYFDNGNIKRKTDVNGTNASTDFGYDAARPHAVTSAQGYAMNYDDNGNISKRSKGSEQWGFKYAGFDKPRWMIKTDGTTTVGSEFLYNADRSRVMHLELNAATLDASGVPTAPSHYVRKRIYGLGASLEADFTNNAAVGAAPDWQNKVTRIYVPAPDGIVGTAEFTPSTAGPTPTETDEVYHYDHLGSIQAITPLTGTALAVTAQPNTIPSAPGLYSEDAWGSRRNPKTWNGPPVDTDVGTWKSLTPRGFTGHEMLDDLGLVHMNGRIYDPLLGRMLSADLVVQAPMSLQSYNRYSYVMNNPLTLTDPTGFVFMQMMPGWAQNLVSGVMPAAAQADHMLDVGVEAHAVYQTVRSGGDGATTAGVTATAVAVTRLTGAMDWAEAVHGEKIVLTGDGAKTTEITSPAEVAMKAVSGAAGMTLTGVGGASLVESRLAGAVPKAEPTPEVKPTEPPTLEAKGGAAKPTEPYDRKAHYGKTPTQADRKTLGAGSDQVVDHDPPLVKRYYEGDPAKGEKPGYQMTDAERKASGSDRERMKLQPKSDSNKQGGEMSKYSREQKKKHFGANGESD